MTGHTRSPSLSSRAISIWTNRSSREPGGWTWLSPARRCPLPPEHAKCRRAPCGEQVAALTCLRLLSTGANQNNAYAVPGGVLGTARSFVAQADCSDSRGFEMVVPHEIVSNEGGSFSRENHLLGGITCPRVALDHDGCALEDVAIWSSRLIDLRSSFRSEFLLSIRIANKQVILA